PCFAKSPLCNPHGCWDAFLERGLFQTFLSLAYDFFRILRFPLSDLINQRLSGSLSVEERIGEKPEWMRNLDPYLANHFSNIELPLPSPLKEYQEKMDEIDSIINDMMVLKEYFRAKFYDEIK
ncbi:hypothetical protein, partial [Klebsiella pneumoniae]|uniref:hypothetical protein n=2 Tax=Klebsiella pneumoniae TaxID=573 RepID=UPI0034E93209